MAAQIGIDNPAESQSCTSCHAPMQQVSPSMFADPAHRTDELQHVSCANCHGGAEDWILSHTRPDYPKDALAKLGMRQLATPYQRANNCVACHQNLSDKLIEAKHPPLVFELDGLLVAEPKHWREDAGFSHTQTWLVGQAVALREAAAQAAKEPSDWRHAEIEGIKALLKATNTQWDASGKDIVRAADDYAVRLAVTPMDATKTRGILVKLLEHRAPFHPEAFSSLKEDSRDLAKGYYAERLVLAIDRLNQSLLASGQKKAISKAPLDDLFDAAKPPRSFDAATTDAFVEKLDIVSELFLNAP